MRSFFAIWALIGFQIFVPNSNSNEIQKLTVKFSPPNIVAEPTTIEDEFYIFLSSGMQNIPELNNAVHIEPLFRRGTSGHSIQGPWVVWFSGSQQAAGDKADSLSVNYLVSNVYGPYVEEDDPFLGEQCEMDFPPTGGFLQNDFFCNDVMHQRHFYMRMDNEPLHEDDWCPIVETTTLMDHDMDCPQAWGITRGDTNVIVAVIDLGVEWIHPALGGPGPCPSFLFIRVP